MNASKLVGWLLTGLLALAFLASAASKFMGIATPMFSHLAQPHWLALVLGVLELLGALGLLLRKTLLAATAELTVIMLGVAYTLVVNHEGLQVLRPVIFIVVLWLAWWLRDARTSNA